MSSSLDDLLAAYSLLPDEQRAAGAKEAAAATAHLKWIPSPGPQTDAYFSPADVLLYGGQGGGGKSDLGLGLALTAHERSLIMRRQYANLGGITDRIIKIHGSRDGWNGSPPPSLRFRRGGDNIDRIITFAGCEHLGDEQKFQGQPFDLKVFDEATQFLELQVRFHLGWIRHATDYGDPNQRCRAVLATNPPINSDGDWIIGFFRPWLDLTHPNPAQPGVLRWYVTDPDGADFEVDGPAPHLFPGQNRPVIPMSRTFIPASLTDNPYLVNTDYAAKLDALPEPIRSAVRDGNFMATRKDTDRQVIPTQWIIEAQARWTDQRPMGEAQVAIAADIAQGGSDNTVISPRYGGWFARQIVKPGAETPDGASVAALIIANRRDGSAIVLDMGGGYGGATAEKFAENDIPVVKFNGANASTKKTKDGSLSFYNRRAEAYWTMREELDPEQEGGSPIALPPDPELRSQLASPTYKVTPRGIQVESKDEIKKRLGVSPDKADSAVMCLAEGKRSEQKRKRRAAYAATGMPTRANMGHEAIKKRFR